MDIEPKTKGDGEGSVDVFESAKRWWSEDGALVLPGEEEGGVTVFEVRFWDGCCFLGHTDTACLSVFERLDDLIASPWHERQSAFVASHVARMGAVVRVIASSLGAVAAAELRDELVRTAPEGMEDVDGSGLEARECFLSTVPVEPVRMSFAEWMKTREDAGSEGES